ncbi:MAG TPA: DinB family protein [Acidimicrobiia bacterium]|jgi:hypothetical protein|nr:DinB family protein [Acidimicrobiia bacterium]
MSEVSEELGARWQSERCPECAFDPNGVSAADLPAAVAGLGRRYQAPLTRFLPGEDASLLVAHPLPGVWSALAYACHVRDVLAVFDARIGRMLTEDAPELGWWDHEAAVEADAYEKQPPAEVAAAVAANAAALSATLAAVPDDAWDRTGTRRDGELFTVLGAGRFALHEGTHHLLDIGRVLRAARGR